MATVRCWTGVETKALRHALRMSVRDFAAHLGVDARTVSKWEARQAGITLLPDSQAILDTALERASDEARMRFTLNVQTGAEKQEEEDTNRRDATKLISLALAAATQPALDAVERLLPATGRPPAPFTLAAPAGTSWASPVYEAVLSPTDAARRAALEVDTDAGGGRDDPTTLRQVVDKVMHASLSSDYTYLARSLPRLIGRMELANLETRGGDQISVLRLLSDVYAVAGWTLIKADSPVAAWIAAQRAVQVAEQADDVLRVAAATRCLSEVHMRARNFEEATRTAFLAAVHLDTARPVERTTAVCLRGAVLLSASSAAARRGDNREAYAALKAASACADELGEDRADLVTVFGPTNVAIHQVAVAVELGNAREAIRHVSTVNLSRMPPELTERRARFLIDVARSHAQLKDDSAALDALLQAETIAPDELREHRLTHELVRNLLVRERRASGLRALAGRCNVLN